VNDVTRSVVILKIEAIEILSEESSGVELNEGYRFEVRGTLPQVADGIAKMAIEMDYDKDFGDNGGGVFLELINQYYKVLKEEGGDDSATTRL